MGKKRLAPFIAWITFLCLFSTVTGIVSSSPVREDAYWIGEHHSQATADLQYIMVSDDERDELHGAFSARWPDMYSFSYQLDNLIMRRILGFRDFTMVQQQGFTTYGYTGFMVFDIWEEIYAPLTRINKENMEWVTSERMAHRDVDRYYQVDDPTRVFWIDQETGIPLMIMEGNQTILSVDNYRFDSSFNDHYRFLELSVSFTENTGKLTIYFTSEGVWVPVEIRTELNGSEITLLFSNWEIGVDQIGEVSTLRTLEQTMRMGDAALAVEAWPTVIEAHRTILQIDPYHLPSYLLLAFAYYNTDNYLGVVENYQQVLMLYPDHPLALNNLAYTYLEQKVNLREALNFAKRAVALERRSSYLDTLGYAYYLNGEYELAVEYLQEALSLLSKEGLNSHERAEIENHLKLALNSLQGSNSKK